MLGEGMGAGHLAAGTVHTLERDCSTVLGGESDTRLGLQLSSAS